MFQEYLYYIIALIIIFTLIIIYILLQKTKNKNPINEIEIPEQKIEKEVKVVEEIRIIETQDTPKDILPKRSKAKVPEHGKISKESFKIFAGTRILVAEDNFINQKVINGLLADTGIELVMADDGQIALDILKKDDDFAMILMDAHMPVLDGFQTTRIIRANPKYAHIVVVALSGDTAADDIKKMTEAGMEEHLEKPLLMDALYHVLYAYTKNQNNTDDFIEIVMTKELNGEKGLKVCGGDDLFYKEILSEFLQNYASSAQTLHTFLDNNEVPSADKLLLDLIGISANIGADTLHEAALQLKERINDTGEKSYVILLDAYKQHLKILEKDIKDYL